MSLFENQLANTITLREKDTNFLKIFYFCVFFVNIRVCTIHYKQHQLYVLYIYIYIIYCTLYCAQYLTYFPRDSHNKSFIFKTWQLKVWQL